MSKQGTQMAPWRGFRTLMGGDPFRELFDMQRTLNQFFEDRFGRGMQGDTALNAWTPSVDVYEDDASFVIKAELPEVKLEDIKVNLEGRTLSISGERRLENEDRRDGYHRVERRYGQFYRSFTLPPNTNAEEISASFKDGVLRLMIPKKEEARPKQIEINAE